MDYEICVAGTPPRSVVEEWEEATAVQRTMTVLRGTVPAQLDLHGLLLRLLELNLEMIQVRVLADYPVPDGNDTSLQSGVHS